MIELSKLAGSKVLVTGAAGCIGAWVVKILREAGATPVVLDMSCNRSRLEMIMDGADEVIWENVDITQYEQVSEVVNRHGVDAIIHLEALQVPLAKADPLMGTLVNVVGTANILECARQSGISRLSYASSIAAPAMADEQALSTLYGAHKLCGEQMAAVYWQDWDIPSVGIRPSIIYGPGRDQGMSSAPTIAMLAAFMGRPYTVPFTGAMSLVHAEDAAWRFVAAIAKVNPECKVFDLNGTQGSVADVLAITREYLPRAELTESGAAMPFPAVPDGGGLDEYLGLSPCRSLRDGIADTLASFESASSRQYDLEALATRLIGSSS
jgi:nucleoside-diphosphate-sugar epimerase